MGNELSYAFCCKTRREYLDYKKMRGNWIEIEDEE